MKHQPPPPVPRPAPDPRHSTNGTLITGFAALFTLVAGFGLWSVTARIHSAIIAQGVVELDERRHILQHASGGTLRDLLVQEGDHVTAGQVLIRLDPAQLLADRNITRARLHETTLRRARLEAETADRTDLTLPPGISASDEVAAGQIALLAARHEATRQHEARLDEQHAQLAAQIDGITAGLRALDSRRALLTQELDAQRSLFARGLTPAPQLRAIEADLAELDGRAGELRAQEAQAALRQSEIALMRLEAAATRRLAASSELRDLGHQETELTERLAALDRQLDEMTIRAPVSGILHHLQPAGPGAVIRPAEPVAIIVPQDRPFVVTARIPASEIDELTTGQSVILRLNAGRAQRAQDLEGRLTRIAPEAIPDETTRAPVYRVDITPHSLPPDLRLLPGMQADLFIQTGAHRPLSYLLAPLGDHISRAMRES